MITKMLFKVALYIRLSREDGDDLESESITNQRTLLQNYVTDHQLIIIDEYIDDGYSGGNFNRPGFKRLLEDIKNKKVNMVITKDLSRLGRDYIDTGHYIERFFPINNIRYVALLDDIDTFKETSGSDVMPFKLGLNDMYAKDISKKVRSTLTVLKKKGLFLGSTPSYGYLKDPNNKYKLIVDDKYSKVVKRIFEMYHRGIKTSVIAEILTKEKVLTPILVKNSLSKISNIPYPQIWKTTTINNILKNPVYTGSLIQNTTTNLSYKLKTRIKVPKEKWIVIENTHEPIISKELFNSVQKRRNRKNNYNESRRNVKYLLSGLIKCKDCQSRMSISYDKKRGRTISNCNNYRKFSKYGICSSHFINYIKLEELIIRRIKEMCKIGINQESFIKKINYIDPLIQEKQTKESLNFQLNCLIEKLDNLYDDKFNKVIDSKMYLRLSKKVNKEIKELKEEIKKLNKTDFFDKEDFFNLIKEFLNMKKITSYIITKLIREIYIHKDQTIEIHYRIKDFNHFK